MRILEWIVARARVQATAIETPIGWRPLYDDITWDGLEEFTKEDFRNAMSILAMA